MRDDIKKLSKSINIEKTIEKFGQPVMNKSQVVAVCSICNSHKDIQIISLKLAYRIHNSYVCSSCGTKNSWTKERKQKETLRRNTNEYKEKISKMSKELWDSEEYREKTTLAINESLKRPEVREKISTTAKKNYTTKRKNAISKKSKELWNTDTYRKKQEGFRTDEYRKTASLKMKEVWEREGYRENSSLKMKNVWNRNGYRENSSIKMKGVWNRDGYRNRMSSIVKEKWKNDEYKEKHQVIRNSLSYKKFLSEQTSKGMKNNAESVSKASRKRWTNPVYRENVIRKLKNLWKDPERSRIASERGKRVVSDPVVMKKMALARKQQSGRQSSIEITTSKILESLSIVFETQKPVGFYLFDFYLEKHDVYIECQGEYWHSLPGRESRDRGKRTYLKNVFPKSRLLYLYEHEFLNPGIIKSKIMNFIGEVSVVQTNFAFSDVNIKIVTSDKAQNFLNSFHYAGFGRSAKTIYGAFLNNELIAVSKYSHPIRKESATSMGYGHDEVSEIDRFCIHPKFQKKNFASWFLIRTVKKEFLDDSILAIISYSDMTHSHVGTIYKASNFELVSTIKPDYYYVNPEGFILNKKTLYNRAVKMQMKESDYAKKFDYKKKFGKEKLKFVMKRKTTM